MQCPNCHSQIDDDAVFCGVCGRQVAPVQAQGATVAEGTQFSDPGNISRGPVGPNNPASFGGIQNPADARRYAGPNNFQGPTKYGDVPGNYDAPTQRYNEAEANAETVLVSGAGAYNATSGQQGQRMTPPTLGTAAPPTLPPGTRPTKRSNNRLIIFIALIVVLLVAGISAGVFALTRGKPTTANNGTNSPTAVTGGAAGASGTVAYVDSQAAFAQTDTVNITLNNLGAPPSGMQYDAWLVNDDSEQVIPLGQLTSQGNQSFKLNFTDKGVNLIGAGNKVEVTQEQGNVNLPQGKIILQGIFPPKAFVHIRHLLFQFPDTPKNIGLVVGLRDQAQKLQSQAGLLQSFFNGGNTTAIQCAAQSIVNIDEGKNGAHFQALADACINFGIKDLADGYGILGTGGYASKAAQHAALAANQSDSTQNIKTHAKHVEIATDDVTTWTTTIDQNALNILNNTGDGAKEVQKIVKFAGQVINGVDLDGDESVDPVPNEAGSITAYVHAQFMALLSLKPAQ